LKIENHSDAVLVILGHGTSLNPESSAPVYQHAAELRRRGGFAAVAEAFWKQEPNVKQVSAGLTASRVFIVPLFISEGYFSEQVIPRALGFVEEERGMSGRVLRREQQTLFYCKPVGTHESMTNVLLARAREVTTQFPFPVAPQPKDTTLFVAGHGTEQNENSRKVVEAQTERLLELGEYAGAQAVFMEEEPRIADCYKLAQTRNIVVVPFFISDGLHVREDIPVLLGEPASIVRQRLQRGQPTWRNPTEKHLKLVWYARSVGTEPLMADVILERVSEASGW
jgi:sirohydrochlorin cobaltochelatase